MSDKKMTSLTHAMKREVASYLLVYTKGLIEDDESCPEIAKAFDRGDLSSATIEEYVMHLQADTLKQLDEADEPDYSDPE